MRLNLALSASLSPQLVILKKKSGYSLWRNSAGGTAVPIPSTEAGPSDRGWPLGRFAWAGAGAGEAIFSPFGAIMSNIFCKSTCHCKTGESELTEDLASDLQLPQDLLYGALKCVFGEWEEDLNIGTNGTVGTFTIELWSDMSSPMDPYIMSLGYVKWPHTCSRSTMPWRTQAAPLSE